MDGEHRLGGGTGNRFQRVWHVTAITHAFPHPDPQCTCNRVQILADSGSTWVWIQNCALNTGVNVLITKSLMHASYQAYSDHWLLRWPWLPVNGLSNCFHLILCWRIGRASGEHQVDWVKQSWEWDWQVSILKWGQRVLQSSFWTAIQMEWRQHKQLST